MRCDFRSDIELSRLGPVMDTVALSSVCSAWTYGGGIQH